MLTDLDILKFKERKLFRRHHHVEFFIVDFSVPVNVNLVDEKLYLLLTHLLSQVLHDVSQLLSADEAVAILELSIEHLLISLEKY